MLDKEVSQGCTLREKQLLQGSWQTTRKRSKSMLCRKKILCVFIHELNNCKKKPKTLKQPEPMQKENHKKICIWQNATWDFPCRRRRSVHGLLSSYRSSLFCVPPAYWLIRCTWKQNQDKKKKTRHASHLKALKPGKPHLGKGDISLLIAACR